jgi:hypothetical protein
MHIFCIVVLGVALLALGAGIELYGQIVSDEIRVVSPSAIPASATPVATPHTSTPAPTATRQTSTPARIAPRPANAGATSPSARPVMPTPEAAQQPSASQSSAMPEAEPTEQQGIDVKINILSPSCIITSIVQICLPLNLAVQAAILQNGMPIEDASCQVRWLVFQGGFPILDQSSPCAQGLSTGLVLQLGGSYRVEAEVLTGSGEHAHSELSFHVTGSLLQIP